MTRYIILYGSESELVKNIFPPNDADIIIRIHGSALPAQEDRCVTIDGRADNFIAKVREAVANVKKGDTIIFIGAAFLSDDALLVGLSEARLDHLLQVNVVAYTKLTAMLVPLMIRLRAGSFIYLSSFRSINPTKGAILYSSAKAFGETFFKGIGREYGRYGVTSHVLRMGYFNGRILSSLGDDAKIKQVASRNSLRRLGEQHDLKSAILFCLDNPFSTAGILELDGGLDFE